MPGISSTSMPAARTSSTLRSAIVGLPGHGVDDLAALTRGLHDAVGDRRVHRVEVVGAGRRAGRAARASMPSRARSSTAGWRAVRTKRIGTRSSAARAAGSSRSAPAGPSPTTTTRGFARHLRRPGRRRGAARGGRGGRAFALRARRAAPSAASPVDALALAVGDRTPRAEPRIDVHLERLQQRRRSRSARRPDPAARAPAAPAARDAS